VSGPCCESCVHFRRSPLSKPDEGECTDPAKIIEGPAGDDWNRSPYVHARCSCRNHETKP